MGCKRVPYKCKPIASRYDANGNSIAEPGLVIRFSTEISVGKNFFGKPLLEAIIPLIQTILRLKSERSALIW